MVHFACFSFRAIAVCAFLKWTLTRAIADFTSWPALYMVGERGDVFPLGLQQLGSQFMCVGGGFYLPGNPPLTHPSFGLGDFGLFCCLLFHSCYYALSLFYIFGYWLSVQKSDVLYIKKLHNYKMLVENKF